MAVDYLSALNVGSGLNVTQIVDALVDAEQAPQEASITSKVDEKTVSISTFAELKQNFGEFSENLGLLSSFTGLVVQSSGNSIVANVKDKSKVAQGNHTMSVQQLATPHTIAFTGFASETATVDASSIAIDLGSWENDGTFSALTQQQTISLDGSTTIADLRDDINELDLGLTAAIVRTNDNNYALTIRAALGSQNQMRLQATPISPASYSNLNFDPETVANDLAKEAISGADAIISFDGITVTRPTNTVDDLIEGISLELKLASNSYETISASYNEEMTLEAIQLFVDEMNTITTTLAEMNKTGVADDTNGPLAGDTLVRSFRNQLRMITTTPITGFADADIFLSSFGVMTNRDGTLSVDETKFKAYFAANPGGFAALANSQVNTSSTSVKAEMTGNLWTPGIYNFVKNQDGSATLDGVPMSLENGTYKITSGGARGLHINTDATTANVSIYVGKSLFETLQDFTTSILKTDSDLDRKVSRYTEDITKYNKQLEALNTKMEKQRELYVQQFSAMETSVAAFKETGKLLDNLMESWRASLK